MSVKLSENIFRSFNTVSVHLNLQNFSFGIFLLKEIFYNDVRIFNLLFFECWNKSIWLFSVAGR